MRRHRWWDAPPIPYDRIEGDSRESPGWKGYVEFFIIFILIMIVAYIFSHMGR